ncbi:MAG: hypothetical protein IBX72_03440 [Nitrospirae bacterium]|nr:hypothetical protein [Nitrospirota bacterium]
MRPETDIKNIKKVAVLPFENFTSDVYAGEKIRRIVITDLLEKGIDIIEPGEVTRQLQELKVKSIGSMKNTEIQGLGTALSVDALMMGAVEAFGLSKGISVTYPEVAVILRLIETDSGNIIWSIRHTSGGPDFWMRHFGSEGPSLSETARKVVKEAVGTLF